MSIDCTFHAITLTVQYSTSEDNNKLQRKHSHRNVKIGVKDWRVKGKNIQHEQLNGNRSQRELNIVLVDIFSNFEHTIDVFFK